MNPKRIVFVCTLILLAMGLAACERTKISDIVADPGSYANKEVAVVGKVTNSIGFMGHGIYQISDGTGNLWVLSETRGVPSKGAEVGVKGRITPTVTFMGTNYVTVMRETDRHSGKASR